MNDSSDMNDNKPIEKAIIMQLELTDQLRREEIVSSYIYDIESDNLSLELNHNYNKKVITSPIESTWPKTIETFSKQLKRKQIGSHHSTMICDVADNNAQRILEQHRNKQIASGDRKGGGSTSKRKLESLAYKYSYRKKGDLHEAVILACKPVFLKFNEIGEIKVIERIEEENRDLIPPSEVHYPYEPYEFHDMNEVLGYIERARNQTIDSLYLKAKQISLDYNDQDKEKVLLLTLDIIWSYFQDKFPTTHYDIVTGDNGSGKSTMGDTFTAVGYRAINLTDPNAANINRILGTLEPGQCTIVSDETGAIDKNEDLMAILKTGYHVRGKTSKINDNSREPEFFYTYCFKMIISERMPNLKDAKGVIDRTFAFTTYRGDPKHDIKETLEPQGNPLRQERLDILNDFRKLMLIYRLLHFKEAIVDIDVGVKGREKELSKPIIQLFYGTTAQKDVEATLQTFLTSRTERKDNAIEAALHPIIANLVSANGNEIYTGEIWSTITQGAIEGHYDEKKPNEYQTADYGTVYRNTITSILSDKFGAKKNHRKKGSVLTFNPEKLARVGRGYNLITKIQTKILTEEEDYSDGESGDTGDGYLEKPPNFNEDNNVETTMNWNNYHKQTDDLAINNKNITTEKSANDYVAPTELSPLSPAENTTQVSRPGSIPPYVYRLFPNSDWFGCKYCRLTGDKWDMIKHCHSEEAGK